MMVKIDRNYAFEIVEGTTKIFGEPTACYTIRWYKYDKRRKEWVLKFEATDFTTDSIVEKLFKKLKRYKKLKKEDVLKALELSNWSPTCYHCYDGYSCGRCPNIELCNWLLSYETNNDITLSKLESILEKLNRIDGCLAHGIEDIDFDVSLSGKWEVIRCNDDIVTLRRGKYVIEIYNCCAGLFGFIFKIRVKRRRKKKNVEYTKIRQLSDNVTKMIFDAVRAANAKFIDLTSLQKLVESEKL